MTLEFLYVDVLHREFSVELPPPSTWNSDGEENDSDKHVHFYGSDGCVIKRNQQDWQSR